MSLNQHHIKLAQIPGEPVREFIQRYRDQAHDRHPSQWEMTHNYPQYTELAMRDAFDLRQAISWCEDNLEYNDWHCCNIYFFFTNDTDAALFRLAYCGDPIDKV